MQWEVTQDYPVFFTGMTGVGKTIACQKLLNHLEETQRIQSVFVY